MVPLQGRLVLDHLQLVLVDARRRRPERDLETHQHRVNDNLANRGVHRDVVARLLVDYQLARLAVQLLAERVQFVGRYFFQLHCRCHDIQTHSLELLHLVVLDDVPLVTEHTCPLYHLGVAAH